MSSSIMRKVGTVAALAALAIPSAALAGGKLDKKNGRMTGGGKAMGTSGSRTVAVTHGFTLRCRTSAKPQRLQVNWSGGNKFHLVDLETSSCAITGDEEKPEAGFDTYYGSGFGRDGAFAQWTFTDYGEPGREDRFVIVIDQDNDGDAELVVDSDLRLGGNHQAHRATGQLAR